LWGWWSSGSAGSALDGTLLRRCGSDRGYAAKILTAFDRDYNRCADGYGRQFAGVEVAFAVSFEPNFNELA